MSITWHTAPAGLYHIRAGQPVPILLVNTNGEGLLPDGSTTRHIYAHIPGLELAHQDRHDSTRNRGDYMAAVREAERTGTGPCHHGEPRGPRYCPHCRHQQQALL
jgi:hypothetical protein